VIKENYLDTLRAIDPELVQTAVSGPRFQQCLFEHEREDLLVLPVLKQTLLEARAADRGLHQLRIDGAQRNLRFIFEKAFTGEKGMGYPPERKEPQVRNAGLLNHGSARALPLLIWANR
jgi:hypothetical protein